MAEIDHVLRNQVNALSRQMVQLDQSVGAVHSDVAAVAVQQKETRDHLSVLSDEFRAFVRKAELTANLQRAETRKGSLADQLDHEYGHYKEVRRSAVGILQAFDLGLVSEETVRMVSEQLMISTPRYWLAPVLVALGAWAADDQRLCEQAVAEAFRRDPGKTSLFMALVLRRQGRLPSAQRWLRHYLDAQDPTALNRDFAVILECVAQGAYGPAAVDLVHEYLDRWRELLLDNESTQDAQVARWRYEIDSHASGSWTGRYPRLAVVSPQWPLMDRALAQAAAHQPLLDKYTAMLAEEIAPTARLEDAIDDILDRLVGEYDTEELPLRRELALNEAVIRHEGDLDAARRSDAVESTGLDVTLDYLTIQSESALNPDAIGVSRSTQRIAVAACQEWFARAHALFTRDYRAALPAAVDAVFGAPHNPAAQAFQLPTWTGSFTVPMPDLERSLAEHWDRHAGPYIAGFAYNWRAKAWLAGAVSVGVALLLGACLHPVTGLLAGALCGGIWGLVIFNANNAATRKCEEARAFIELAKQDSLGQLRAAGAELADWSTAFRAADAVEARVRELTANLAVAGHAASPYQRRTVAQHHAGG